MPEQNIQYQYNKEKGTEGIKRMSASEENPQEKNLMIYHQIIQAIFHYYQGRDVRYMFTHGGCFWLASVLNHHIEDSIIVLNRTLQHCACNFNHGVYDISGRISARDFYPATPKDIFYMKKHFIPDFDTAKAELYISEILGGTYEQHILCGG